MLTSAKLDLDAYNNAMSMTTAQLVTALRDLLGAKLVAYLGRVKETRAVRQWAEGTRSIANPADVDRLRVAYRAAAVITARDSEQVAQAWFQGLNPLLDDQSEEHTSELQSPVHLVCRLLLEKKKKKHKK